MRKLIVFNQVSLDGYFTDVNGDMSWAHKQDAEWNEFVEENAKGGGELLFGRITYDLMKNFWPTPIASESFPIVAERMNNLPKVVFSRNLDEADWNNTRLIKGNIADEVRKLKADAGDDMVIMGSGTIISQLVPEDLIDEYQIVVNPIVLGAGRSIFEGVNDRLALKLITSRQFKNGNVVLCYEQAN